MDHLKWIQLSDCGCRQIQHHHFRLWYFNTNVSIKLFRPTIIPWLDFSSIREEVFCQSWNSTKKQLKSCLERWRSCAQLTGWMLHWLLVWKICCVGPNFLRHDAVVSVGAHVKSSDRASVKMCSTAMNNVRRDTGRSTKKNIVVCCVMRKECDYMTFYIHIYMNVEQRKLFSVVFRAYDRRRWAQRDVTY